MNSVPPNGEEKKEIKPKWKSGAILFAIVLLIVGTIWWRGLKNPVLHAGDPSAVATDAGTVGLTPTPPDLSDRSCEDPLTKCANGCPVTPSEVGSCDWSAVGGSTKTPEEALATFATALKRLQAESEKETVDQAYSFDQFLRFYKKTLTEDERKAFRQMDPGGDTFRAKALELLLKN
jgi:hypothetical protein